jgi:hypothetical protein
VRAPTTTARDKKELLRALLEEVIVTVNKDEYRSHLTLRWRGGALVEIDLDLPRRRAAPVRTDEDTVALERRLAVHYPDAVIAGILNRQQRTTAYGHRFTANHVGGLRRHWNIARYEAPATPPAMRQLGVSRQTVWQRVKRGEIEAIHVRCGRKKGLRLKLICSQPDLFGQASWTRV